MIDVLADLKSAEGFRPYCYDDATGEPIVPGYTVVGNPTLWWGLNVTKGQVPPIPQRIPDECLEGTVGALWLQLTMRLPWLDEQPEDVQGALKQMIYNMGVPRALGFKRMWDALKSGDRETAAAEALDSEWHRNPKTAKRAEHVADLIRGHR